MKTCTSMCAVLVVAAAGLVLAQQEPRLSPRAGTAVRIGAKKITIQYSAPSVRGRRIFGEGGVVSKDATYPVWRAGDNEATALHTDADLVIKGLAVPTGDYTIYVLVNTDPWQLIINKQTGQSGSIYDKDQDLGRVPMDMRKPPAPIETYTMTLSETGPSAGKLQLEFENFIASVPFTVK
jgi:hypothetical protein